MEIAAKIVVQSSSDPGKIADIAQKAMETLDGALKYSCSIKKTVFFTKYLHCHIDLCVVAFLRMISICKVFWTGRMTYLANYKRKGILLSR